jgi:hypothetical protein
MKAFVTYLKKPSPPMQRASGSTGWIELPNGQRWNPGRQYKFNAHEPVRFKRGAVIRFIAATAGRLVGSVRG